MSLVDDGTLDSIREKLFPLSKVITPNIYEAAVLTGIMIEDRNGMEEAAKVLKNMGTDVVVITGGHLEEIALDLYYDGEFHSIEGEKIKRRIPRHRMCIFCCCHCAPCPWTFSS